MGLRDVEWRRNAEKGWEIGSCLPPLNWFLEHLVRAAPGLDVSWKSPFDDDRDPPSSSLSEMITVYSPKRPKTPLR